MTTTTIGSDGDRGLELVADKSSIELSTGQHKRAAVQLLWFRVDIADLTQHFLVQRHFLGT